MRSTRLAILAVTVGAALLGWSTAGVSAIGGDVAKPAAPAEIRDNNGGGLLTDFHHDHRHHDGPGAGAGRGL